MKTKTKLLLALLVMTIALLPLSAFAASQTVTTWAELKAALADSSVDTIVLGADLQATEKLTVDRAVTIDGSGYSIERVPSYVKTMLTVSASGDLTLKDITIDGMNNYTFDKDAFNAAMTNNEEAADGAFVTREAGAPVSSADLITVAGNMTTEGVTIQNHAAGSTNIIDVTGTLTTKDTTITHCSSSHEGTFILVSNGGEATLSSGTTITDIQGARNGVVGRVNSNSKITVEDGVEINNVYGVNCNASVFMAYGAGSTINIEGGVISNNYAIRGSANGNCATIYLHTGSTLNMSGGEIADNTGRITGGILSLSNASSVNITGGTVENNVANNSNYAAYANLYLSSGPENVISGGTFSQQPSTGWLAEGFVAYNNGDGTWTVMSEDQVPTPTPEPTAEPTPEPTEEPADDPTEEPEEEILPTEAPTVAPTAPPSNPVTGDSENILLWSVLLLVCGAAVILLSRKVRA